MKKHYRKGVFNRILPVLFLLSFSSITNHLIGQTYIQDWDMIGESENFVDVYYCVVDCNGLEKIYIQVFNEKPVDQTASFDITIVDPSTSNQTVHNFSNVNLTIGEICIPECGTTDYDDLKLDVPSGFDAETLTVEVTFN